MTRNAASDDADVKAYRKSLDMLSKPYQLLFRLLACTGMRLGEAFGISSEATERGVRYCIVCTKTETSKRRVPFPAVVLPSAEITGPLFQGAAQHASKGLNRIPARQWHHRFRKGRPQPAAPRGGQAPGLLARQSIFGTPYLGTRHAPLLRATA
jgi:integrase